MGETLTQPENFGDMSRFKVKPPVSHRAEVTITAETASEAEMRLRIESLVSIIQRSLDANKPTSHELNQAVVELTVRMEFHLLDIMSMINSGKSSHEIATELMKSKRVRESLN